MMNVPLTKREAELLLRIIYIDPDHVLGDQYDLADRIASKIGKAFDIDLMDFIDKNFG